MIINVIPTQINKGVLNFQTAKERPIGSVNPTFD